MKHLASQLFLGFSNYFLSSILLSMPWISIKGLHQQIDDRQKQSGHRQSGQSFQCLHDGFANEGRFDLTFAQSPQVPFNTRRDGLDLFIGKVLRKLSASRWSIFGCQTVPGGHLFDDQERRFLVFFVSRETAPTFRALPDGV